MKFHRGIWAYFKKMIKGPPVHKVAVRMGEEREEERESLQTKGLGVCVVEQGGGWIPAEKTWVLA